MCGSLFIFGCRVFVLEVTRELMKAVKQTDQTFHPTHLIYSGVPFEHLSVASKNDRLVAQVLSILGE